MKQKLLTIPLGFLLAIPLVFAFNLGPIESILELVLRVGSFVWVTDRLSAVKFAIFVVVFAILYGVLHSGFVRNTGVLQNKKVSVVIAFSLAALSVIFIPSDLALEIGTLYSAIVALFIMGVPVALLVWFGIKFTKEENFNPIIKHGIRLILALACVSLISGVMTQFQLLAILPFALVQKKGAKKK